MSMFYTRALTRCSCGKPATVEVLGPGNSVYGHFCEAHGKSKVAELEKAHSRPRGE